MKTFDELDFVDKGENKMPIKVVLYGKPGTGKTTLASTFPKPALLLDISEMGYVGVKRTKGLDIIRVKSVEEMEIIYWHLKENRDGFKTVIIDTVSGLQDLVLEKQRIDKKSKVDKDRYGEWGTLTKKDWGEISSKLKSILLDFRDLDMNVIFISHERVFNVEEDDLAEGIEPSVGPRIMPSVASTLNAAVDVIANTFIREKVDKEKKTSTMQYCLRVGPHSYYITKIRRPLGCQSEDILVDASYEDLIELTEGAQNV